ncbi:MAG: prepilin-type N-terminal cleavage/methylation domain-containing protein [Nibricoccus sp.]
MVQIPKTAVRSATTPRGKAATRGLTLVEVMVATVVLALVLTTSISVLGMNFNTIDTARNSTIAAQVMQSEIEQLRLLSWTDMLAKVGTATTKTISDPQTATFVCTRTVTADPARPATMLIINISTTWKNRNGTVHTRSFSTNYAKGGISDYYVTRHS